MVRRAAELSSPGRALDAGCGDSKDTVFLASRAWDVYAFDISKLALASFRKREATAAAQSLWTRHLFQGDVSELVWPPASFQLVIAYGLYHCLDDGQLLNAHAQLAAALSPGGLFAFAAFNDDLPLPENHGTIGIVLRSRFHIFSLVDGWAVEALEFGTIAESHEPVIGQHEHSLTWGLFRKPDK
jgi:SAM-dependent methyltransferase